MDLERNEIELLLIALDSIIVPNEIQLHPKDRTTAINSTDRLHSWNNNSRNDYVIKKE